MLFASSVWCWFISSSGSVAKFCQRMWVVSSLSKANSQKYGIYGKQQVGVGHQDLSCKSSQSHDLKRCCLVSFPSQHAFAFFFCLDLLFIPSIKTLSCSIFVFVYDSAYRLSGFYRRQLGANHYGQLKCSSALACGNTVLPVCRPTSRAGGRLQHQAQSD